MPDGKADFQPHAKSMPFGYLAAAGGDDAGLDRDGAGAGLAGPEAGLRTGLQRPDTSTNAKLLRAFEESLERGRKALAAVDDARLQTQWQLLVTGRVVNEDTRQNVVADTFTHLAHHRGQLSVYLRLLDVPVPSIYGPTADDRTFG